MMSKYPKLIIDFHAHFTLQDVLDQTMGASLYGRMQQAMGLGAQVIAPAHMERMTNMAVRLADMDKMRLDMQVISPSILQQCTYPLEPELALKLDQRSNEYVAELVARHPDRLIGLGSLPLQAMDLALRELERLMSDLKLKGVVIGSNVNGIDLGDQRLRPFWRKAEELGAVVFIHPAGNDDPKMMRHKLMISVGQPLEETFALSSLVYDGVMDECPRLKIVVAHGGGYIPFYAGRHDHMYRTGLAGKDLKGDFSAYLNSFYYDSVLFNPDMLETLGHKVDPSRIILATDYPFGEWKPLEFVERATRLPRDIRDAIVGENAARLFGLPI